MTVAKRIKAMKMLDELGEVMVLVVGVCCSGALILVVAIVTLKSF